MVVDQSQVYFHEARSWADDFYATAVSSRNRWRASMLYVSLPLIFCLLICVMVLVPMQHVTPILIHHYDNGFVTVEPMKTKNISVNRAATESDLVRYVMNRESFSAYTYENQYALVNLLSSNFVANQYRATQSPNNKSAPLNLLGEKGYRTVRVESVVFLMDAKRNAQKPERNLAEVNFTVTDHLSDEIKSTMPLTALISWEYSGTPDNPDLAWKNWDGLRVTYYEVRARNNQANKD